MVKIMKYFYYVCPPPPTAPPPATVVPLVETPARGPFSGDFLSR